MSLICDKNLVYWCRQRGQWKSNQGHGIVCTGINNGNSVHTQHEIEHMHMHISERNIKTGTKITERCVKEISGTPRRDMNINVYNQWQEVRG